MSIETPEPQPEEVKAIEKTFANTWRSARETVVNGPDGTNAVGLTVRDEGAMIRELTIDGKTVLTSAEPERVDEETGESVVDNDLQPAKMDGTISVLSYGSNEAGPQHGLSRTRKYSTLHSAGNTLELMARDPSKDLNHFKTFTVEPNGLTVIDEAVNTTGIDDDPAHPAHETQLSIGEHYYFAMEESQLEEVQFLEKPDPEQPGRPDVEKSITVRVETGKEVMVGAQAKAVYGPEVNGTVSSFATALMEGKTLYYDGFDGSQDIFIPGIGKITLSAEAINGLSEHSPEEGQEVPVAILIWHRKETNTICFEPVAGVRIGDNSIEETDTIKVEPKHSVRFTSRIQLAQAA